jgi:catechol 2,3-dioxygenase-like lactoylglutathione lyase family enzyme
VLVALDHVNLRTANLEGLRAFYEGVLGMRVGPRPSFPFGGLWLYCGDTAVIHLVEVERAADAAAELRLEHFALRGQGLMELIATLERHGIARRASLVRDFGIYQVNIHDPDGNHLHIDFPLAEAEHLGLTKP